MTEPVKMLFEMGYIWVPPGKYDWMICAQ